MPATDRIQVRIDAAIKKSAEEKLREKGFTISEFTRMILADVANNKLTVRIETANNQVNASLAEVVKRY
ncbi:type II toxin-antitoxin system RelB/DinJ family antitoxin [Pediococcus parvulus]|uniref:type II toxin-antitoxin system RelB/DinJ family antitoxin n=1 Tax=Pediococcus parvulus TaxID=54062 RepID=UPI003D072363